MKENSEMKAVLALKKNKKGKQEEKKTRTRDLSKSEGVHKHSKDEKQQKI